MNLDIQPFLENDLVIVKPMNASYFNALYEVASDSHIWEQHQEPERYTLELFTTFFEESLQSQGALIIVDKKSNKIIGSSRFKIINREEKVVEIGWSFLSRKFWGGKYNRSVKKLMLNYALATAKRVVFYVNVKNIRSQKALEKLGAMKMEYSNIPWVLDKSTNGITYLVDKQLQ
ncbi:MAG: GNAT family N-acetyltransferase [Saonia sp.]